MDAAPVNWSDENQRERIGLDLRGADLREINLESLPLARTCAGPIWVTTAEGWLNAPSELREKARIHLESANLSQAHLEGSNLVRAYMERAYLVQAHLEEANLSGIVLEKANLTEAHLDKAILTRAHIEGANLLRANLERTNLSGAFFDSAARVLLQKAAYAYRHRHTNVLDFITGRSLYSENLTSSSHPRDAQRAANL